MTDQKRKSTRNFTLEKPESDKVDLANGTPAPIEKNKNKNLIPIIIGLLAVLILGYIFFMPQKGDTLPATTTDASQIVNQTSSDKVEGASKPEQSATNKQNAAAVVPVQSDNEQINNQQANSNQPKEIKPVTQLPYKKGEAYKVYLFPFGKYDYSQANPELDKLAEVLKQNPSLQITITAYTDDIGSEEINMSISSLRAKSIQEYLVSKGIDAGRMKIQGKGISTKYATKADNRRAEFLLN